MNINGLVLNSNLETSMGVTVKKYTMPIKAPEEVCVDVVTNIASVCYKSEDKSSGSQRLFNMLMKEGAGNLPSTALEYVTVNINMNQVQKITSNILEEHQAIPNIAKYGYEINGMWVTNMRALYTDLKSDYITRDFYNKTMMTKVEYSMPIYKIEGISMYTFGQLVRHREASYQVLSRRWVSDDKHGIEFFHHPKLENGHESVIFETICNDSIEAYKELVSDFGVKKEVARGVIPQFATTELWFKFTTPLSMQNFQELRGSKKAQDEIREISELLN